MKTIAIFLVVAVLMAGAAFVVVSKFLAPENTTTPQAKPPAVKPDKPKVEKEKEKGQREIFMVEELLVNPTGTSGTRFLSVSLGLEVANHEVVEQLEKKKLQVRDLLITILSSRTVDELTTASARERMRQEISDRLNQLIAPDKVSAVYFVDYVLQ